MHRGKGALIALVLSLGACGGDAPATSGDMSITGPDFAMPDLVTPDLSMPDLAMPDLAMPDLSMPDLSMPDFAMPDLVAPDLVVLDLAKPDLAMPDLTVLDLAPPPDLLPNQNCGLASRGHYYPPPPTAPQTVTTVASGLGGVQGIAIGADGQLYVSNTATGVILKINPSTGQAATFVSGLVGPAALTFDAGGNLVVAERDGKRMTRIPITNGVPGAPQKLGDFAGGPWGAAYDAQGNLYTANEFGTTVDRIRAGGQIDYGVITNLSGPLDVMFDLAGNLYVSIYTVQAGKTVLRYTPQLALDKTFSGYTGPIGLALDRAGNLYVASYGTSTVTRTAPDGTSVPFIAAGLSGPHGIAFDGSGALYVVNNTSGTVVRTAAFTAPCP